MATNVVASRPLEQQQIATPNARANGVMWVDWWVAGSNGNKSSLSPLELDGAWQLQIIQVTTWFTYFSLDKYSFIPQLHVYLRQN